MYMLHSPFIEEGHVLKKTTEFTVKITSGIQKLQKKGSQSCILQGRKGNAAFRDAMRCDFSDVEYFYFLGLVESAALSFAEQHEMLSGRT